MTNVMSSFVVSPSYLWKIHELFVVYRVANGGWRRNLDAMCTNLRLPTRTRIQFVETWPARTIYGYPVHRGHRCELVTSSITILDSSIFRSVEKKPGTLVRVFVPLPRWHGGERNGVETATSKWHEEGLTRDFEPFKIVKGKRRNFTGAREDPASTVTSPVKL